MSNNENPQVGLIDLYKSDIPVAQQIAKLSDAMGKDLRVQVNLHTYLDKNSLDERDLSLKAHAGAKTI